MIKFIPPDHPLNKLRPELKTKIARAQENRIDQVFSSAGALCTVLLDEAKISAELPAELFELQVRAVADKPFKELLQLFDGILSSNGVPEQTAAHLSLALAERLQLITAFENPEAMIDEVRRKVAVIVSGFPQSAADIQVGRNPGDVLDPYILAATQWLMFGGDFEPAIEATVAHKALMMVEGLMGHLHEDVIGAMRGNIRCPEPRGEDQENLDPATNPFPGADVLQPPYQPDGQLRFHQLKSKTGSAKGGDGVRLGTQLKTLQGYYGKGLPQPPAIFYHALIGNTLRGHRSRAGVERAAPDVIVLVGEASFRELTGSAVGPQLLLRLYQSAFQHVAAQTGYRADTMAKTILAVFQERSQKEGEGFLEVLLHDATAGPKEQQDNRFFSTRRQPRLV